MMSVFSCLSVLSLCYIVSVSTESVPIPENVSVKSLDMGLVLKWDPPRNAANKVFNYTAEVRGWRDGYEPVCVRISSLSCDFTDDINAFGIYALRVRTELHGDASDSVVIEDIKVDKITEISAPHVELTSRKGQTEVDITDPPMRKNNLRGFFRHISYLIRFWKKGEAKKKELIRDQSRVMLPDLEPLVNYCVEVAVLCQDYNKTGQFSNTTCVTNSPSGEVEPWIIAVVTLGSFLVVVVAIVLIFLAVWFSYEGCKIIFPDPKLPENLKQFLSQQSQSPILSAMQESTQPNEHFHELRIFHKDNEPTEGPSGIQTDKDKCHKGADIKQTSEEKSEMDNTTSEEEHLLAELRLL
ncbi:interleukin-10 receptor subunit beta-like [Pseudorasbora parva]|uniref:interleukin-10 receptor subunit beta-like n=1 Tax=Pseudorasbora parva TaxID=51549 RepID=UPI00351F2783